MSADTHLVGVLQLAKDGGVIGNTDLTIEISRARVFVDVISFSDKHIACGDMCLVGQSRSFALT